jgi:drug/metabolite transporter (DMT)-like permease
MYLWWIYSIEWRGMRYLLISLTFMEQNLIIALISGSGGMLGWGFADFFAKKTIDKIGDITTLFWSQLIGIFPIALLFIYKPFFPRLTILELLFLPILGIWSGLSYLPVYTAFGKGKLSLISPIFASYGAIVVLLSVVFLHEAIPSMMMISLAIVFIGLLLINGDPRDIISIIKGKSKNKVKGLPEILIAVFLYSIWLIMLDKFLDGRYWVPFLLVIRIFSMLSLLSYARIKNQSLNIVKKNYTLWKFLILIGIFDVAAFSFVSYGFSTTSHVSIVAMLSAAFSLPTIILSRIFLKEKVSIVQTAGSLITIGGVVLLSAY